jgi:DeoR/GlpR family transcriptional regulator of sugar metabolism
MEVHKRRQMILALLDEGGEASVDELSARLEVSPNTIRNDLNAMDAEQLLRRVRGGAVAIKTNGIRNKAFINRSQVNRQAKELMGQWAANLVNDGDALVLDASSTIYCLATLLTECRDLQWSGDGATSGPESL